jgi:CO dehydrogenase/acetyl-CoA synthase gamma subunit (corrinoid Fe-S protein)
VLHFASEFRVRHLKKYLIDKNIDCYLLVVNTNGTNVWCATVEGIFQTEKVLSYLKIYDVQKLINHNRLVLPQLGVAGIKRNAGGKVSSDRCISNISTNF